ncbi:MAG: hypothetical protein ACK56I_19015, partial [bacterium]
LHPARYDSHRHRKTTAMRIRQAQDQSARTQLTDESAVAPHPDSDRREKASALPVVEREFCLA